ncbi:MAG: SUMF1/EgtB/PvdO family nonheme iron enzyme [Candidatus Kapabacteria bacterium]|nr:SUMF1/EgtB/PvdO family nonheme iron enzyme [Candidatus Kapabacteria bacterium]
MLKYILILFTFCTIANAQTEIIIHKTNNSQDRVKISDIDSITFSTTPISFFISSLLPASGKVGDEITIKGKGFGDIKGTSYVDFNSKASLVYNNWTDAEIKCTVPTGATTGILFVWVNGKPTNGVEFKIDTNSVKNPDISPNKGFVNTIVNISGKGFGSKQGNGYVTFNNTKATSYIFWKDTLISCYVPTGATTGNVKVFTDKEETININSFTVQTKQSIKQTVYGRVIDENKKGILGADVTLHGKTTKTDEYGVFLFENADVPNDRLFAVAKKSGYFETTKAGTPNDSGLVQLQLLMPSRTLISTVQSSSSSTISLNDNAKVLLTANSYNKADGTNYSGSVKVYAQYYSPSSDTFAEVFPGDALGVTTNGLDAYLYSYGFINVELEGANGEQLNLKSGTTAELHCPKNGFDKDTIPLWYYDMAIGKWKEEGIAIKSGNILKGKVSHFSQHNLDVSSRPNFSPEIPPAIITGTVSIGCEENRKIEGIGIQVGQQTTYTDKNGVYRIYVPIVGNNIVVKNIIDNKSVIINNLVSGKEYIVNFNTKNNSFIVGRILDCYNKLFEEMVYATWGMNGFTYNYAKNGLFKLTLPIKTDIQIQVGKQKLSVKTLDSCEVTDLGIIKECDTTGGTIEMRIIPSGTFIMGNISIKQPVRAITISKSFLMGKYEVTQKQWKYIYGTNPSYFKGNDNLPIENITWIDAVKFCNDLSLKEGLNPCYSIYYGGSYVFNAQVSFDPSKNGYRLPTEAEWEYSARSSSNTDFYQGNADDFDINMIAWNSTDSTHIIGFKKPNAWGLYDMHGNVNEYVNDIYRNNGSNGTDSVVYNSNYKKNNANYETFLNTDPLLSNYKATLYYGYMPYTIIRGGAFNNSKYLMQTYFRTIDRLVNYNDKYTGFRVARNK